MAAPLTLLLGLTASSIRSVALPGAEPAPRVDETAGRESIRLSEGWRFQRDDPPGNTVSLDYDVRPEVTEHRDDRAADARPEEAEPIATPVLFTVEGPAEIVATDNGDPTSFAPFQSPQRPAFNGLCLAIVRAKTGAMGPIRIAASSEGLAPGRDGDHGVA